MHFLLLKAKGYTHEMIADILEVSVKTTFNWAGIFQAGHFKALATLNYKGQPSKLREYGEQLVFEFIENPIATFKQTRKRIMEITGLERSLPQVRNFLLTNKLIRRKVGQIPGKVDVKAQDNIKKNKLDRLVKFVRGHHVPQGRAMSIPHPGPRVFLRVDHECSRPCSGGTRGIVCVNLTDFHQDCKCSVKFFCANFLRMDSPLLKRHYRSWRGWKKCCPRRRC